MLMKDNLIDEDKAKQEEAAHVSSSTGFIATAY